MIHITEADFNRKIYNGSRPKRGVTLNGIDFIMKQKHIRSNGL